MHNYLRSVTEVDCPASFFVKGFNKVSHHNPKCGGPINIGTESKEPENKKAMTIPGNTA